MVYLSPPFSPLPPVIDPSFDPEALDGEASDPKGREEIILNNRYPAACCRVVHYFDTY